MSEMIDNDELVDLQAAYNILVAVLRSDCQSRQPTGIGGMWTPDSVDDNGDLILRSYSGGYEHHLMSRRFNFKLIEGYSANGTEIKLSNGSTDNVRQALNFYAVTRTTESDETVGDGMSEWRTDELPKGAA